MRENVRVQGEHPVLKRSLWNPALICVVREYGNSVWWPWGPAPLAVLEERPCLLCLPGRHSALRLACRPVSKHKDQVPKVSVQGCINCFVKC